MFYSIFYSIVLCFFQYFTLFSRTLYDMDMNVIIDLHRKYERRSINIIRIFSHHSNYRMHYDLQNLFSICVSFIFQNSGEFTNTNICDL